MRRMRAALAGLVMVAGAAVADDAETWPVGTASNMWREPYLVGSYRHWDQIYPVRVVEAGDVASVLERGTPIEIAPFWANADKLTLEQYVERGRVTGLLVIRDGLLRFEHYGTGADETSLLTSQSMAKSVVATLVGIAEGEGLIASLDDPIDKYVPELAASGYAGVPIEAVLQMSSGIAFREDYSSSVSDSERMWVEVAERRTTSAHDFLLEMEAEDPPYAEFNYKGADTQALGWLLEAVTGTSLSDYLSRRIWQPAGMEADAVWGLDGEGPQASEVAYAGLNARLRDWGRFGLLMANDGVWNGTRLLPEGWVERATRSSRDQVMPGKLYAGYALGYQYQWWTYPGPENAYAAHGINGQFIYVDPSIDLVVVQTAVWRAWWDDNLERAFYDFVDEVAKLTETP